MSGQEIFRTIRSGSAQRWCHLASGARLYLSLTDRAVAQSLTMTQGPKGHILTHMPLYPYATHVLARRRISTAQLPVRESEYVQHVLHIVLYPVAIGLPRQ